MKEALNNSLQTSDRQWVFCLPTVTTPLPPRFLTKFVTDPVTGCWNWTAAKKVQRYLNFEPFVTGAASQTEVTSDFDGKSRDIPQSEGVVPTEISSPRRLRVKGTDTDSLMGGRIESGETGIPASDGAQANHEASPQLPYTTAGDWVITEPAALPAVLAQLAAKHQSFTDRVMARLSEAERRESNLHLKADYRQSWICLSFANRGLADPFVQASYQMYGVHPSKVWERIVADRKEHLGAEYWDWYDSADNLRPDLPKFPPKPTNAGTPANRAGFHGTGTGPVPFLKSESLP